jgi:hypothetical protein
MSEHISIHRAKSRDSELQVEGYMALSNEVYIRLCLFAETIAAAQHALEPTAL